MCDMCVRTVGSNYSQYEGTSSGSETVPLNPAPARGAATAKPEHQTLLDIDNPEQNANSFGKPFESSVSTTRSIVRHCGRVSAALYPAARDEIKFLIFRVTSILY